MRTVLVAGQPVKRDGVTTVDLARLIEQADTSAEGVLAHVRAAVSVLPLTPPGGVTVIGDMAAAKVTS